MPILHQPMKRFLPVSAAAVTACTFALGLNFSGERAVMGAFETALAGFQPRAASDVPARAKRIGDGISGSEEFWLSSALQKDPFLSRAVAVGDRLTVETGGSARELTVTAVEDISAAATRTGRVLAVTCRDQDRDGAIVRFMLEVGATAAARDQAL